MNEIVDIESKVKEMLLLADEAIASANNLQLLEQVRVEFLGKKSHITQIGKLLSSCPASMRPTLGATINHAKLHLRDVVERKQKYLREQAVQRQLNDETLDVSLPGRHPFIGRSHPVMAIMERAIGLLQSIGFSVHEGLEIEDFYHNFEALNIPKHHPALSMQDTFYLEYDNRLLRTQTSSGQIHVLENKKPPVRVITPGKVYRRDSDPTHTPMFHQLEALVVDVDCHFSQLKQLLNEFLSALFKKDLQLRFRPSYFPFTEPSAEVDIQCHICQGQGCALCKQSGWIEVLGCGMVHPNVLKNVNIDPAIYNGYAFGLGIDRIAMLYYGINDLRLLFENDIRFLGQF